MKLEDILGLSREKTLFVLTAYVVIMAAMIIKLSAPSPKKHFQIISNGEYHLTTDPIQHDGCVEFTDENGEEKIFCGHYSMKKI